MYRNCYYDSRKKSIYLRTWDEDGKRVDTCEPFSPYLYIESSLANDAMSIFNTKLKKLVFPNLYERKKYVASGGIRRLFFNLKPDQQYLIEKYNNLNKAPDFDKHPLKIFYLDLEIFSPLEFPNPEEAKHPINLISVYDSLSGRYTTFGLKQYNNTTHKNVDYIECVTETLLLKRFLQFWSKDYCDIVTGWNIALFDMPYLYNRIAKILGDDEVHKLSPFDNVYKHDVANKFDRKKTECAINIAGLNIIDYLDVYKTFTREKRESYKLDYIGSIEVGEGKIAINTTNLAKLSEKDWQTFVEYNIQDVNIILLLENKLNYLKIIRMFAYSGLANFEKALGKAVVLTGCIALKALERNQILSTFIPEEGGDFVGAWVQPRESGVEEYLTTFDLNSLYPNTIITLNISPETKIGKILSIEDNMYNIQVVNGTKYSLKKENFEKFVELEKIVISKQNIMFTQKKRGVIAEYIDDLYKERVKVKKQLSILENELLTIDKKDPKYKEIKLKLLQLDNMQYVIKIQLNALYGVTGQKSSAIYDVDIASSVTITGQAVIKEAIRIIEQYYNDKFDISACKPVIYGDTDSSHITIKPILEKLNIPFDIDGNITPEVHKIVNDLNDHVNSEINLWARKELHTLDPRFEFKKENICSLGIYQTKKHYILHIKDKGDKTPIPCDKIKYTGVDVVKTTMSEPIKKILKNITEGIIRNKSKQKALELYKQSFQDYKKLPLKDIATRSNINKYEDYEKKAVDYMTAKGTPVHVKAAFYYNKLLKEFQLNNNYESIHSGDKIKWFYCMNNKYDIKVMAFMDVYPPELYEIIKPDLDIMFDKSIHIGLERIFECFGWNLRNVKNEIHTDLFDLFKL